MTTERQNKAHNQRIDTLQEEGTIETGVEWLPVTKGEVFGVLSEHLETYTMDTEYTQDEDMIYVTPTSWIDSKRKVKICKETGEVMEFTDEDEV